MGRDGVHEESGSTAQYGDRAAVPVGATGAAAGQEAAEPRTLHGRWHAIKGVGLDEELPAEGRWWQSTGGRAQRRARLSRREAVERDPCQHDGPRRAALPQGERTRERAVLHGTCADGE